MLVVGRYNSRVNIIATAPWTMRFDLEMLTAGPVHQVAISPDGRFVVGVGERQAHWTRVHCDNPILCMQGATHDGTATCTCKGTRSGLGLFPAPTLADAAVTDAACPKQAHTAGVIAVTFSRCGQRLATGGDDHMVILWDAHTGEAQQVLKGHNARVVSVSFSSSALLASGSSDGSIRVWDTTTGALVRTIIHTPGSVVVDSVQFSPTQSQVLLSAGYDTVKQWNVDTGEMIFGINGGRFGVFAPDGLNFATATPSSVLLCNADTGAVRFTMNGVFYSATFSIDGSQLALGKENGSCELWNPSTGMHMQTLLLDGTCFVWGRDWVQDEKNKKRAEAFAMGDHPRLGASSLITILDDGVIKMILDRV
jgi:WD40 repeat protein